MRKRSQIPLDFIIDKRTKNELDVDFIGGEGSLTKEEEIAISQFILSQKKKKGITKKTKTSAIQIKTAV